MRIARVLATLALVALIASCKKGPTAPGPYNETVPSTVASFGYTNHTVDIPRDGNLTLTLTWQGVVDLDLYLTSSACGNIYADPPCQKLAVSEAATGQSETVTRPVTKGEAFRAWVDNFTATASDYSLQIQID